MGRSLEEKEEKGLQIIEEIKATNKLEKILKDEIEDAIIETGKKKHPMLVTLDMCRRQLRTSKKYTNLGVSAPRARGAVAELMLGYLLKYWGEENHTDIQIYNNVLLPKYPNDPNSKETTQLDTVAVTNKNIIVFEVKSYAGNLEATPKDLVSSTGVSCSPWTQNANHIISFKDNIRKVTDAKIPYIRNVVYVFSEGKFIDWSKTWREPEDKFSSLIVTQGAWSEFSKWEEEGNKIDSELKQVIGDICTKYKPSVREEAEHVLRLQGIDF